MPPKPLPKLSAATVKTLLHSAKLRSSAARIAVVQCLARADRPLTHNEVTELLADMGLDQSTVYRCLTELAEAGLLLRLDLGDAARRYELIETKQGGSAAHPHFFCVDCGKIQCLAKFTFRLLPQRGSSLPGRITEVLVKGHCNACQ